VFSLPSDSVYIDLLTDSGTAAMSDYQWARDDMMGDESYAGSKNYFHLKDTIRQVMGYEYVVRYTSGQGCRACLDERVC